MVIVRADGNMGKGAVLCSAIPMDDAGRAVNDVSGMKDFYLTALYLMVAHTVGGDQNLSCLMAVPTVIGSLRKDDIRPFRRTRSVRLCQYLPQIDGVIEIQRWIRFR